jgi:hypothetical protein
MRTGVRRLVRREAETDRIRAATRTVLAAIESLLVASPLPPIPLAPILLDQATQVRKPPASPVGLSKVYEGA